MFVFQIIMIHTLLLYSAIHQFYLNKTGGKINFILHINRLKPNLYTKSSNKEFINLCVYSTCYILYITALYSKLYF